MKKTKVVCTMGPNTNDRELMRKLIQNGMDVARFNFSHGDHEEQKGRMDMLKELREEETERRLSLKQGRPLHLLQKILLVMRIKYLSHIRDLQKM